MNFEFDWPNEFWENCVLIYWWESNKSDLKWKVNLDLWDLFIAIVPLGLTYLGIIMTLASTVFQKINFSKKFLI